MLSFVFSYLLLDGSYDFVPLLRSFPIYVSISLMSTDFFIALMKILQGLPASGRKAAASVKQEA